MDSKVTTSWDGDVESSFKIPNLELARRMKIKISAMDAIHTFCSTSQCCPTITVSDDAIVSRHLRFGGDHCVQVIAKSPDRSSHVTAEFSRLTASDLS
jgi:hypothetical protein